jgi:hypothetical protein
VSELLHDHEHRCGAVELLRSELHLRVVDEGLEDPITVVLDPVTHHVDDIICPGSSAGDPHHPEKLFIA